MNDHFFIRKNRETITHFLSEFDDSFDLFSRDFEFWKTLSFSNSKDFETSLDSNFPLSDFKHPDRILFLIHSYFCLITLFLVQKVSFSKSWNFPFLTDQLSFDWLYKAHFSDSLINEMLEIVQFHEKILQNEPIDYLGKLYQQCIPKSIRMFRGEFFTPQWLADNLSKQAMLSFERWNASQSLIDERQFSSRQASNDFPPKRQISDHFHSNYNNNDEIDSFSEKENRFSQNFYPKILDPSCGSGVFFLSMIRIWKKENLSWRTILSSLVGLELNPISVMIARANILLELLRDIPSEKRLEIISSLEHQYKTSSFSPLPIYLFDTIRNVFVNQTDHSSNILKSWSENFDIILGNPPWISWDQLSKPEREMTKPLWIKYGLFNLSGKEAQYGGGKKELAALLLYLCADRYLKKDGFLAMVLPQSLFQTPKAGEGFRCFRLPESDSNEPIFLKLLELNDFSRANPFPEVNGKIATILLQKNNKQTEYPVLYRISDKSFRSFDQKWAQPIHPNKIGSPLEILNSFPSNHSDVSFSIVPEKDKDYPNPLPSKISALTFSASKSLNSGLVNNALSNDVANFSYRAQLGANTAGANSVYWLKILERSSETLLKIQNDSEAGKRKVLLTQMELEEKLIYPLLRWKDVDEFYASPSSFILISQDAVRRRGIDYEEMTVNYPQCLKYLSLYENVLKKRAAYQKFQSRSVFWSMYNINEATFAPIKVIWRRMDKKLRAAVITTDSFLHKPIIPQETISMIAVDSLDEAHYLTAMLNSDEIRSKVASFSVMGSKSFGSPGILSLLNIPRFDPNNPSHITLSQQGWQEWERRSRAN